MSFLTLRDIDQEAEDAVGVLLARGHVGPVAVVAEVAGDPRPGVAGHGVAVAVEPLREVDERLAVLLQIAEVFVLGARSTLSSRSAGLTVISIVSVSAWP